MISFFIWGSFPKNQKLKNNFDSKLSFHYFVNLRKFYTHLVGKSYAKIGTDEHNSRFYKRQTSRDLPQSKKSHARNFRN